MTKEEVPMNKQDYLLTEKEVGDLEWNSADLDMAFADEHPKEIRAICQAQQDKDWEAAKCEAREEIIRSFEQMRGHLETE